MFFIEEWADYIKFFLCSSRPEQFAAVASSSLSLPYVFPSVSTLTLTQSLTANASFCCIITSTLSIFPVHFHDVLLL